VTVFVDTSALYALVDEDEDMHRTARGILHALRGQRLATHAYVLVETMALVARRLPPAVTVRLLDGILPIVEVEMVDVSLHREALAAYRASGSRSVSLVDRTSFEYMRRRSITTAFAFDADFETAGFDLVQP